MKEGTTHEFGGNWTLIKLELLERYLAAFNTALKDKPSPDRRFKRIYIDAFAGTGKCSVFMSGDNVEVDGSARIALEAAPGFDCLHFIDLKKKHVRALNTLSSLYSGRDIQIWQGDANEQVEKIIKSINWKDSRAVMFLDPYGMAVSWETLAKIAATEAIDLWYLFPISGVCRQAAHKFEKVGQGKADSLTRILGTNEWVTEFYRPSGQSDFFREQAEGSGLERHMDWGAIQRYVKSRLENLFPVVLDPVHLPITGSPLFSLFFVSSNPNKRAMGLTKKIADHILNMGRQGRLAASGSTPKGGNGTLPLSLDID